MTSLELAVRFGKTLIIQEMDGVEPVLYPLLRRDLIVQGMHTLYVRIKCRKTVDFLINRKSVSVNNQSSTVQKNWSFPQEKRLQPHSINGCLNVIFSGLICSFKHHIIQHYSKRHEKADVRNPIERERQTGQSVL